MVLLYIFVALTALGLGTSLYRLIKYRKNQATRQEMLELTKVHIIIGAGGLLLRPALILLCKLTTGNYSLGWLYPLWKVIMVLLILVAIMALIVEYDR